MFRGKYYRKNVHAHGRVVLVMSGTNPESKNTVQRCHVPAAIWQITPAAQPIQKIMANKNFARLQVLLDERIPD